MKIVNRKSFPILLLFFFFQSCFPDFGNKNFKSFPLYLYNNSSQNGCISDSIDVTFVIKNESNANSKEVRIVVPARDQKNAQIEGTRDEFISVKLLNSKDTSQILEQRIAIGRSLYEGGDLATRKISYCGSKAFVLSGFAK
jgi:hypothetical protein